MLTRLLLKRAKATFRREVESYLEYLGANTPEELGMILATTWLTRQSLLTEAPAGLAFPSRPLDGLPDPQLGSEAYLSHYHNALGALQQQARAAKTPKSVVLSSGVVVWKLSIRSVLFPELLASGRRVWSELRRGIESWESALDAIFAEPHTPEEISALVYFPAALCPWASDDDLPGACRAAVPADATLPADPAKSPESTNTTPGAFSDQAKVRRIAESFVSMSLATETMSRDAEVSEWSAPERALLASFVLGVSDAVAQSMRLDNDSTLAIYTSICSRHLGTDAEAMEIMANAGAEERDAVVRASGQACMDFIGKGDATAPLVLHKLLRDQHRNT